MDIRQLEAYVYTVKYRSFSLAAQKLYLSQPTVSAHICNLEKELHTQLLKRTTKTLSVTPAGQTLYNYAAEILDLRHQSHSGTVQRAGNHAAYRRIVRAIAVSAARAAGSVPREDPGNPVPHQLFGQSGCDKQGRRQHLRYRSGSAQRPRRPTANFCRSPRTSW